MNNEDLDIIIEAIKQVRRIRSKQILAEIERIRSEGNNEKNLKSLKKLENDLEEIVKKEIRERYYSEIKKNINQ